VAAHRAEVQPLGGRRERQRPARQPVHGLRDVRRHQWAETGIFSFLDALPAEILRHPDNGFVTPSEAIAMFPPIAELDVPCRVLGGHRTRSLRLALERDAESALRAAYALETEVNAPATRR
jgi:alpha-amylase/alpha-mannosidase (GH57 family)